VQMTGDLACAGLGRLVAERERADCERPSLS
jgi:hypothetical protein